MPIESEIKLALAPEALKMVATLPLLRCLPLTRRRLVSSYFDTADQQLSRAGMALRLRCDDGRWFQTLKFAGRTVAGLSCRKEVENELPDGALALHQLPDADARRYFDDPLIKRLTPLFTTDFERTCWQMPGIELALDAGQIRTAEKSVPLCEIELELKKGEARDLFALALRLAADLPLAIDLASKAAKGYALCGLRPPPPPLHSQPVDLSDNPSCEAGFLAIVANTLDHLQGNLEPLRTRLNAEAIHQFRVALRRLQTALELFSPLLPNEAALLIGDCRRWLRLSGPLRDLDTLPPSAKVGIEAERQQLATTLAHASESSDFSMFILRLGHWLHLCPWRQDPELAPAMARPLGTQAPQLFHRLHKKLARFGHDLEKLDDREQHRLRVRIKRLHYSREFFASEFVASLPGGMMSKIPLADWRKLQKLLGELHDATFASQIIGPGSHSQRCKIQEKTLARVAELWPCVAYSGR